MRPFLNIACVCKYFMRSLRLKYCWKCTAVGWKLKLFSEIAGILHRLFATDGTTRTDIAYTIRNCFDSLIVTMCSWYILNSFEIKSKQRHIHMPSENRGNRQTTAEQWINHGIYCKIIDEFTILLLRIDSAE